VPDLTPYIGIAGLVVVAVCALVVLKRNGLFLRRFKHDTTEMEFDHYEKEQTSIASDAGQHVDLPQFKISLSSAAKQDCEGLGIAPEDPLEFVVGEATRHPILFQTDFTSLPLVFHENVLLLSCESRHATIERILNRSDAYPLNDAWSACLAVYRQATLLPYRTKGTENLRAPAEAQRALTLYRRLVSRANEFLESLKRNQQHPFGVYGEMSSLVDEAEFALASEDMGTSAARFEVVLSTVHKLILQNAPQGPLSTRVDRKATVGVNISNEGTRTVLLVDDEFSWLEAMRHVLKNKNFAITVAPTTGDALRAIVDHEFDLVITDLVMGVDFDGPEADGREVALAVKKSSMKTKVIVLTAYVEMSRIASLLNAGVDDVIDKAGEDLLGRIEAVLADIEERPRE